MTTPPPPSPQLDPMTVFFLGSLRQAALIEFFQISGLQPDIFAACLDRAADAAKRSMTPEADNPNLRQAVAMAEEEARQLRLGPPKG